MGLRKAHRLIRLCDESCELVLDGGEPQYNRARMNRGGFLNTNVSNLSNVGECVFFFPPRITRILAAWAALTCIRMIRIDSCLKHESNCFIHAGSFLSHIRKIRNIRVKKQVVIS